MHRRFLKECAAELAKQLYMVFRKSLQEERIPSPWKLASVTPIFKKGSHMDPSKYCPFSLTSVRCKIMENLIRDALMKHMVENDFLSDCQHGCVKRGGGGSCTTQ